MKIEEQELIGYLKKISKLHDKVQELTKEVEDAKTDAMNWFTRWQTLRDKYEPEQEASDNG